MARSCPEEALSAWPIPQSWLTSPVSLAKMSRQLKQSEPAELQEDVERFYQECRGGGAIWEYEAPRDYDLLRDGIVGVRSTQGFVLLRNCAVVAQLSTRNEIIIDDSDLMVPIP